MDYFNMATCQTGAAMVCESDKIDRSARLLSITTRFVIVVAALFGILSTSASASDVLHSETRGPSNFELATLLTSSNGTDLSVPAWLRANNFDRITLGSFVAAEGGSAAGTSLEPLWAQAPNDGFLGGWSTPETLQPGTVIDRYGAETGRFFSPEGTSLEARSLPPGSGPYSAYEVLKPLDVQGGIAAPAFGQSGLGVQYMSSQTVADLIEGGFIKPVDP
jgi:hypothetical protein